MILYLYGRQFTKPPDSAKPETAAEYSQWSDRMEMTGYSPLLKFFVSLRTAQAWRAAFTNQAPEVNRYRRIAMKHLEDALHTEEMPAHAAYDACLELYNVIQHNDVPLHDKY